MIDLLVVGAGPTGIAIGAEARRHQLDVLLVDRGALTASILEFPTDMTFFTTREKLEIADVPFTVPEEKPNRRQALRYYRAVVERHGIPLALHEEVLTATARGAGGAGGERGAGGDGEGFAVRSRDRSGERQRLARTVALATGYFDHPRRLGVEGESLPWVHHRYREPYAHFGERVVVVGGGNSAAEAAMELWRNGAAVTLVHRGAALKPTVKYWLKPDVENRIAEGAIAARFDAVARRFVEGEGGRRGVELEGVPELLPADAVYVLIGYLPDVALEERCGITVDPVTLVPAFDPATCESNVPGLFVAGTLQAGRDTGRIFIENSRDHGERIVAAVRRRLRRP